MKVFFGFFFLVILQFASAQNPQIFKLKKYRIAYLKDSLQESSGLNFFGDQLYTFNDSGNSSELFQIHPQSGRILNKIKLAIQNTDWEALANDGSHFYVGDFGNNAGSRKDLKIYKIPLATDSLHTYNIAAIPFFYPEQKNFAPKNLNHDYDTEAMIFHRGNINIFTKEWSSKAVTRYIIHPNITDSQAAVKLESYPINFVVTDAAYFSQKLYLVGYTKKTEVFLSIFTEDDNGLFFSQKPQTYYLGTAFSVGQVEGIAVNDTGVYISSEKFVSPIGSAKASLYFIPKVQLP